jgi:hypothetical protein
VAKEKQKRVKVMAMMWKKGAKEARLMGPYSVPRTLPEAKELFAELRKTPKGAVSPDPITVGLPITGPITSGQQHHHHHHHHQKGMQEVFVVDHMRLATMLWPCWETARLSSVY